MNTFFFLHRSSLFLVDAAGRIKRDATGKSTTFCRIYIVFPCIVKLNM